MTLLAVTVGGVDGSPFPAWGDFFSPPLEAGCGGSGLSRHVRRRLQLLHRAISNLVFPRVGRDAVSSHARVINGNRETEGHIITLWGTLSTYGKAGGGRVPY